MKTPIALLSLFIVSMFGMEAQVITYKYNAGGGCISRKLSSVRIFENQLNQSDKELGLINNNAEIHLSEDNLTILISGVNIEESIGYELFNLSGQKIISGLCVSGTNTIDISMLASGIYVLSLNFDENPVDYKFIK